jgi:hypothetical protein
MKKILSALHPEWIKIQKYRTFWILTGIYAATLVVLLFSLQEILSNSSANVDNKSSMPLPTIPFYVFPGVWHNLTYIAGYLKIFPAFLIIILITNEFTFRTLKQQIISGTSLTEFLIGKIGLIFLLSVLVAMLVGISALIAGLIQSKPDFNLIFSTKLYFIPVHALELFTYIMVAASFAFLLKRAGITVIAFLLYSLILERILVFKLPWHIGKFLPIEAIGHLIPVPNTQIMQRFGVSFIENTSMQAVFTCFAWIIILTLVIYGLLKKRDL